MSRIIGIYPASGSKIEIKGAAKAGSISSVIDGKRSGEKLSIAGQSSIDPLVIEDSEVGTVAVNTAGKVGFTGSAGSTNLVFTENENTAVLTNYKNDEGDLFTVRTAEITDNGAFVLNLAGFTPIITSSVLPASILNWDVPVSAFEVTIDNPADFTDRYISSVKSIEQTSGHISTELENFTTSGPNNVIGGGVDWQQIFNTDYNISFIRSSSNSITGGSASAIVIFNEKDDATNEEVEFTGETASFSVSWRTPTVSASILNLSGSIFLKSYESTNYTISVTGISNNGNFQHTVQSNNGVVSNFSGDGIITFDEPIHKDNTDASISLSVSTIFTRPQEVTGTSYTASLASNSNDLNVSFLYPSFSIFTASSLEPPTREMIVNGSDFSDDITVLEDSVKLFSDFVDNNGTAPVVFWFGVRGAAAQPTVFRTGASSSLLSDVAVTSTTVQLAPDEIPAGYLDEEFYLYGIILQPGSTFISIE